jgi:site-specific DNA recombinase
MNAVIYCRVSTKEQTTNLSLSTQEKACRVYCQRHGMSVDEVFIESGQSAKTVDREQFQKMIEYCRIHKKRLKYVVVYAMSRFSRNVFDTAVTKHLLSKYGIEVRSATEGVDNSPTGQLMGNISSALAQFDNHLRAERTKTGMRAAAEIGKFPHKAPLGYKNVVSTGREPNIIPDPDSAPFVRQAFAVYGNGQASLREVLRKLNASGFKTKKGVSVSAQTFSNILRNPIYKGEIYLPEWGTRNQGSFEPLVSSELFLRVQTKLDGKSFTSVPRNKLNPDFPLRVFVACGYCGTKVTGSFAKRKYGYYWCRNPKCKKLKLPKESLETSFLSLLSLVQFKSEYLRMFRAVVEDAWKERGEHSKQAVALASKTLSDFKNDREKLIDAVVDKRISKEIYDERIERLDEQIAFASIALHDASIEEMEIDTLLTFAERVLSDTTQLWLESGAEQRQSLQRIVFPDGVTYSHETGFGTPVTGLLFMGLEAINSDTSSLVSPMGFEPMLSP